MTTKETRERLQKMYNKYFSFLGFRDIASDKCQPEIQIMGCHLATSIAFGCHEISWLSDRQLKHLMKMRLLDSLLPLRKLIENNIARCLCVGADKHIINIDGKEIEISDESYENLKKQLLED